jgi:hypothetical protein
LLRILSYTDCRGHTASSAPRRSQYTFICCGLPSQATRRRSVIYHIRRAVEVRLPPPAPPCRSQYISKRGTSPTPPATIYVMRAVVEATQPPPAPRRFKHTFICCGLLPSPATMCGSAFGSV